MGGKQMIVDSTNKHMRKRWSVLKTQHVHCFKTTSPIWNPELGIATDPPQISNNIPTFSDLSQLDTCCFHQICYFHILNGQQLAVVNVYIR
jgi:hypothetical protein